MKCKICGGELLFKGGEGICQSCGTKFIPDCAYENIEVYICYKENDEFGRRTKDSIVAQEVYRKLESNNIKTFYERVSADGQSGDKLDNARYSAIHRAKAIIVLGASVESFTEIESKYGECFTSKTVVPFCVDVTPGEIPKTLTNFQAINYSSIGWDTDLINGLNNLLGKENTSDIGSVYSNRRKKRIFIVAIIMLFLLLTGIAASLYIFGDNGENRNDISISQAETLPKSQQEIYEEADELLNQGKLIEALKLFSEIPGHPDSVNKIKLIYSKYEGYYQSNDVVVHLDIQDNINAVLEIKIVSESEIISTTLLDEIVVDRIDGDYVDSHHNAGKLELLLENDGLRLKMKSDSGKQDIEVFFKISEKSEQPIVQVTRELLIEWLKNEYTYSQIRDMGYDIEFFANMSSYGPDVGGDDVIYKIKDTNIYLSMIRQILDSNTSNFILTDDPVLIGVSAPAEIIAPSMIGKKSLPDCDDFAIYWPNAILDYNVGWSEFVTDYFEPIGSHIESDTIVGVYLKSCKHGTWDWVKDHVYQARVKEEGKEFFGLEARDSSSYFVAESETHYLYKTIYVLSPESADYIEEQWVWCKIDKYNKEISFIAEDTMYFKYTDDYDDIPSFLDEEYDVPPKEFAKYFPDLYGSVDNEGSEYIEATTATQDITIPEEPTYSGALPYTVSVDNDYTWIYREPSYDGDYVDDLPIGTYTIVEEIYDKYDNLWGKLESGEGWICLSNIF